LLKNGATLVLANWLMISNQKKAINNRAATKAKVKEIDPVLKFN
jgi:hypothetical protein